MPLLNTLKLSTAVRWIKNEKLAVSNFLFVFFVLLSFSYVLLSERENVYSIKGNTEALTVTFTQDSINQWNVGSALLLNGFSDNTQLDSLPEDSYFFPNAGSIARISMIEAPQHENQLFIVITSDNKSVGFIETPQGVVDLLDYVEIKLPIARATLLPFKGKTHIGEDVGQGVNRILLSGEVRVIEQQFFKEQRYVAGEYSIDSGDRLVLYKDEQLKEQVSMKGFIRISNNPAFDFTIHGVGKVLTVSRLGSAGYQITPSLWARLTKEPIIAALTTLFATLFLLMEFADLFFKLFISLKNKQNN